MAGAYDPLNAPRGRTSETQTMNTLTDAIAAYRAAQTVSVEAKRDAYEAILQHMAADTPEDADYESATQDLMEREGLDRVDTPVEPVEEPEPTRFYVAVPASDRGALIAGIGVSESLAIQDAYRQSNSHPPAVSFDETLGHWQVVLDGGDRHRFDDEDEANRFSAGHGFVAQRCTWRLYDHVDRFGAPESWTEDARGYQDVDYDRDDVTSLAQAVFLAKHAETDEERELAHVHLERTLRGVADRAMVFDDVSANREAVDVVILRGSDAVTLGIGASLELTRGSTRQLRYSPERTHRIVEGTLEGSARDAVFELLARDLAGIPASALPSTDRRGRAPRPSSQDDQRQGRHRMTTETTITLVHAHFDPAHLEAVKAEMRVRGAPVIRVLDVAGELYAFEGCHRLRAAEALGLPVRIERLDYEGTIDLDTLDYDDYGWFDDRSAAPIAEVFERMHDAPEAYVRVAIADAD